MLVCVCVCGIYYSGFSEDLSSGVFVLAGTSMRFWMLTRGATSSTSTQGEDLPLKLCIWAISSPSCSPSTLNSLSPLALCLFACLLACTSFLHPHSPSSKKFQFFCFSESGKLYKCGLPDICKTLLRFLWLYS